MGVYIRLATEREERMNIIRNLIAAASMLTSSVTWADEFDYYVMALSWTPSFCELEGDAKNSDQCDPRHDFGWTLHGLWPQYHQGWPSYCNTLERQPSRQMTNSMTDIMGTSGLAWHQWKKHGTCSGLSARDYFDLSRTAYSSVTRPAVFKKLDKTVQLPASVIEDAFLKANAELDKDMVTVTCRNRHIQEVRICLSKSLDPVPCGRDVIKDCSMTNAILPPVR